MLRYPYSLIIFAFALLAATGTWAWKRFGPTTSVAYIGQSEAFPEVRMLANNPACNLTIRHYKQIGREMQFELYAAQGGLAPYTVEITQKGQKFQFRKVPHRAGIWLTLPDLRLSDGPATIRIVSENSSECVASAEFDFNAQKAREILSHALWIRQGSEDLMLDVRPVEENGKLYLKDFANYQDGRNRVYLIDNIIVDGLENGLEIKPGYLYSVIACWIDAPYQEWWNKLRNRTIRQQNVWIDKLPNQKHTASTLTPVPIPDWFGLSRTFNVQFDTQFPKFEPIPGKLVMQYRLNAGVPPSNYFERGVTHLPRWEETVPPQKTHWTEPPGYFKDKNEAWFSGLSRAEVEKLADGVYPSGVYAYDFEFWNRDYSPAIRERLVWFSKRLKERVPSMQIFDYWGGAAYHNPSFFDKLSTGLSSFSAEYQNPTPTYHNFEPLSSGERLSDYLSISPVDVYPKSFFSGDPEGITPNNYLLLSAIHTARINRLFPSQKNNKTIWFAWNRYMPLFDDPSVPWNVKTSAPAGEIQFDQLVTMPASQALAMSLFSLIESDGYYLWHDSQAWGAGVNNYQLNAQKPEGYQWYPADGKASVTNLRRSPGPEAPRYWDYPTEFYALGNWMAKQVEDVLVGGKKQDLAYKVGGTWHKPTVDQAVVSAKLRHPFVFSVVKNGSIVVLAVDSFQKPNATKQLSIRLPNGTETQIQLYGNWPSLYRGTL
ncbi:hypothetical protein GBK04_25020 [Cytophagaceae bacterium SJW1-29]|uniref:Uncharacterized protein n=1 Tax=Salmonirosea aquatica TaxID=2654236 RepID=A0A7C9FFD0_9BACT|nr:hypothetical protein [Cytophagaceae bacterium SJW1-29]